MRKSAPLFCALLLSLSARRAWIEMLQFVPITTSDVWSLSARRAWIEMCTCLRAPYVLPVALRKESVDRNGHNAKLLSFWPSLSARRAWIEIFAVVSLIYQQAKSLSARRAWIEITISNYCTVL